MEFKGTIDLGQVILGCIISALGWFVKKELTNISLRLDGHDDKIFELMKQVSILLGAFNARQKERNH